MKSQCINSISQNYTTTDITNKVKGTIFNYNKKIVISSVGAVIVGCFIFVFINFLFIKPQYFEINDKNNSLNGLKIVVPRDAYQDKINLTVNPVPLPSDLPKEVVNAGTAADFGPDKTEFKKDIEITMPYNDVDNDGILDGTNIKEENICALTYDNELGRWLYLKKIKQDKKKKTITFLSNHFSIKTVGGIKTDLYGRDDISFFTIDGLKFEKVFAPGHDTYYRPSYLRSSLIEMELGLTDWDIYVYGDGAGESWSGDANYTSDEIQKLNKILESEFNRVKSLNKKFIIMTHSWVTVLSAWSLVECKKISPDLIITLSSPLGTKYVENTSQGKIDKAAKISVEPYTIVSFLFKLWIKPFKFQSGIFCW